MKYVSYMGEVYRLSDRAFVRVLEAAAEGGRRDGGVWDALTKYGDRLGAVSDLTDITPEWAKVALESEKARAKR